MSVSFPSLPNPLTFVKDVVNTIAPGAGDALVDMAKTAAPLVDQIVPDAGDIVEDFFDMLGLEALGDMASLAANVGTGNVPAIIADIVDLSEHVEDPGPPPVGAHGVGPQRTRSEASDQVGAATDLEAPYGDDLDADATIGPPASGSPDGAPPPQARGAGAAVPNGADSARAFMAAHQDPEAFLDAIRTGEIPEDLLNSPQGMMMVQQRLTEINRMFQLMTQMMDAVHQMNMAIVRNIRA